MHGDTDLSSPPELKPLPGAESPGLRSGLLHLLGRGLHAIFVEHRLPWRVRRMAIRLIQWLNASVAAPLRRCYLPCLLHWRHRKAPDDVTVVVGFRNRCDHRLLNLLESLRWQTYPRALIRIVVVDYGSEENIAQETRAVCDRYDAGYVRVATRDGWSRSRCLNIGIRRATTKYILTSDVDLVFEPSYVSESIVQLRRDPLQVVIAPVWDLPESSLPRAKVITQTDLEELRHSAQLRDHGEQGIPGHPSTSIAMTLRWFHQRIGGYDEVYEGWGAEDRDLFWRLVAYGLRPVCLSGHHFYLHQWHSKYEGVLDDQLDERIRSNHERFARSWTIVRNRRRWSRPTP